MVDSNNAEVMREIGKLEGKVEAMEARLTKHENDVAKNLADLNTKMDEMIAIINMSKGGWLALTKLAAIVVGIIGGATWLIKTVPNMLKGP